MEAGIRDRRYARCAHILIRHFASRRIYISLKMTHHIISIYHKDAEAGRAYVDSIRNPQF